MSLILVRSDKNFIQIRSAARRYRTDYDKIQRDKKREEIYQNKNQILIIDQLIEIEKNMTLLEELKNEKNEKKENIIYNNFLKEYKLKRELRNNLRF
jgi:hypothetical protein